MKDNKSNVSDKASEIAKSIWLAGLGAYGKAYDEAHQRLDKVAKEPPRLFKELVEKGSQLEEEVRDSLSNIRKTSSNSVEERINRVRENFDLNLGRRSVDLAEIHAKLDALTAKVDKLAKAMAPKAAPRKAAARKKAPVRSKQR